MITPVNLELESDVSPEMTTPTASPPNITHPTAQESESDLSPDLTTPTASPLNTTYRTFQQSESDVFAGEGIDWSLDWISSDIQLSDSESDDNIRDTAGLDAVDPSHSNAQGSESNVLSGKSIDWSLDWISSNIQLSDTDDNFQGLAGLNAVDTSHSTAQNSESDVFGGDTIHWSPDWISSNVQFSESDYNIKNISDLNHTGICAGIPLQERIAFFEGLENVGIEDTPYSPPRHQPVQPTPAIVTPSPEYGTGLTITSSLVREVDIAGMSLHSFYLHDKLTYLHFLWT